MEFGGAITPAYGHDVGSSESQSFNFRIPIQGWSAYPSNFTFPTANRYQYAMYTGANAYGSTATKILYFPTLSESYSNATLGTWASDSTNGTSFTVGSSCTTKSPCFASGKITVLASGTAPYGITVNAPSLTTSIISLSYPYKKCTATASTSSFASCSISRVPVFSGDVIRPGGDGTGFTTTYGNDFMLTIEQNAY